MLLKLGELKFDFSRKIITFTTMKQTAFILATFILLLTIQPALTGLFSIIDKPTSELCSDNCCKNDLTDNSENKNTENCCSNGICNPFEHCACCVGVTIVQQIPQPITIVKRELKRITSDNFFSKYLADCFHPPEIV